MTQDVFDVAGHGREPCAHRRLTGLATGDNRVDAERSDGPHLPAGRGHDDDGHGGGGGQFDGSRDDGRAPNGMSAFGSVVSIRSPRPAASTIATAASTGRGYWRFANTILPVAVLINGWMLRSPA